MIRDEVRQLNGSLDSTAPVTVKNTDTLNASKTQGSRAYFVGSIIAQASALVRFTILSRILGPSELGLAATIILTGHFFDAVTENGGDRFLIQDSEGDSPKVQELVQLMLSTRGVLTAIFLLILAVPIAGLYGTPALAPGIALLAISPLVAGFTHMDMRRQQRHHDFRTESLALVLSEILAT
jgi:O-antigen/teichoic acid export membrane protein